MTGWIGDPEPTDARVREFEDSDPDREIQPGTMHYIAGPVGIINAIAPNGANMLLLELTAVRENEAGGVFPTATPQTFDFAFKPAELARFIQAMIDGLAAMEHRGMLTRDANGNLR